jgi:hypothetical protein
LKVTPIASREFLFSKAISLIICTIIFADVIKLKNPSATWKLKEDFIKEFDDASGKFFDTEFIDDKVFMLDYNYPAVFVYNLNGEEVKLFDRKGEGPGEYITPTYVWKNDQAGSISIYDEGKEKIIRYDSDLNLIEENPRSWDYLPCKCYSLASAEIDYYSTISKGEDGKMKFSHKVDFRNDSKEMTLYETNCHMFLKGWYKFDQPLVATRKNDFVFGINSRNKFHIDIYNFDGLVEKTYKLDVDKVKIPSENLEEEEDFVENMKKNRGVIVPPEIYEYEPIFYHLASDEEDCIYAMCRDEEGNFIRVIENDKYIANIRLEENDILKFSVKNNKLYLVYMKEDEVPCLKCYSINKV